MRIGSLNVPMSSMQLSQLHKSGSRVRVPVKPSQAIVAQYRHIAGTPAVNGQRTVPLTRIHILNSLISHLNKASVGSALSTDNANALIKQYAAELHQAISLTPEAFGTLGGSSNAGILFQISA